jgi:hypothetical protein
MRYPSTACSFWYCYWKTFRSSLAIGAIIKTLADAFGLAGPLSIGLILAYVNQVKDDEVNKTVISHINQTMNQTIAINNQSIPINQNYIINVFPSLKVDQFLTNGYILAILVLIATFLQSIFSNNFNHLAISEGIHVRSALQVRNNHSS